MDFGKVLIGVIGYGFALLALAGSIISFVDLANMADRATPAGRNAAGRVLVCGVGSFIGAVITRLILGAI